jgi:signal transduction histidine kinase
MTDQIFRLLALPIIEVPAPVAVDGIAVSHGRLGQCSICEKCATKACLKSSPILGEQVCDLGVRFFRWVVDEHEIVVYGLAPLLNDRSRQREFSGRKVPGQILHDWVSKLKELFSTVQFLEQSAHSEALDSLHDVSRLATEVASLSNELVESDGGVAACSRVHLSLLKSSELLVKEFDRLELLINPAAAASGHVYSQVYKLCHKYAQIIDFAYCKGHNKRIRMSGRCDMTLRLYESVSALVFALIENAAKYCFAGEQVEVSVNEAVGCVDMHVTSVGPLIEPEEMSHIFERGFRGKWARANKEGRGVGLHLAKIVADAHETKIQVESRSLNYARDSIPCARNVFSVRFHEV